MAYRHKISHIDHGRLGSAKPVHIEQSDRSDVYKGTHTEFRMDCVC